MLIQFAPLHNSFEKKTKRCKPFDILSLFYEILSLSLFCRCFHGKCSNVFRSSVRRLQIQASFMETNHVHFLLCFKCKEKDSLRLLFFSANCYFMRQNPVRLLLKSLKTLLLKNTYILPVTYWIFYNILFHSYHASLSAFYFVECVRILLFCCVIFLNQRIVYDDITSSDKQIYQLPILV